jgi:hypothetical protein
MVFYGGDTTSERRRALEARITAQRLLQLYDDDGDGLVTGTDLETLELIMADADDAVTGILLNKGYTLEQLDKIRLDRQVVVAWAGIAAQLSGERKPEWLNAEGRGPFDAFGTRGRGELGKLAAGILRSQKEVEADGAGINQGLEGQSEPRTFFFAPDPNDPNDRGPGGF